MHPFAGVIENADQSSAIAPQPLRDLADLAFGRFERRGIVQFHARDVFAHVVNHHGVLEPKRLVVQARVRAIIDVAGDTVRSHANTFQRGNCLRGP